MEFHIYPKGICPKVNIIARLKFKLAYFEAAVQHISPYTTETTPYKVMIV